MLYFPQLASGAVSQFPSKKRVRQRTAMNKLADGSEVKLFDPGACRVEWEVALAALTSAEWDAISTLFQEAQGRLGTFVFLDPFGNLLCWSEDLSAGAWTKDAGLTLTSGVADPLGGAGATRISGSGQVVKQTAAVPSWYRYCFSAWVRSDAAAQVTLFASAGAERSQQTFTAGGAWRRFELGTRLATQQGTADFGITISSGAVVEVFGFQVEPQVGASSYKATSAKSGVYTKATFLDDVLAMTSEAPGIFSCTVRVGARG